MKFKLVGINVIKKENNVFYVLHCVSEEITGRDNFTGQKVETLFLREKQMIPVKIGDFIIPNYEVNGGKAFLLGISKC